MDENIQPPLAEHPAHTTRRHFLQRAGFAGVGAAGLIATASLTGLAGDITGLAGEQGSDRSFGHAGRSGHSTPDSLHDAMRRVWEDHIAWTRLFIVSFAASLDDLELVTARLLRNQDDIGDLFRPTFGDAVGDAVSELLREHIVGASAILQAAMAGDAAGTEEAIAAWYVNGDDIAGALSTLNRQRWPLSEMQSMMRDHLDLTLAEGVAQMEGRFADSIALFDEIHDQILAMADMLTDGLLHGPRRRRP